MKEMFKNWKTSAIGFIAIVTMLLQSTGVITPAENEILKPFINPIIDNSLEIIIAVIGIYSMFRAKD
tara:strand:- start:8 stop:208 length:201 start_codon:yes stop_codon:yes gene_type:complete